ncbi:hypothetical protein [Streptomyces sp. MJP52]|uniref:hypothetical protein n=1 Tax=Streptomyces sp. MJP52 TaxID=2940555 RepID=UPI0024731F0B|nr:hypothetical protein [Streptomyces sp. MJP52]MDH6224466.1 hypothetical protein [Streptomyces sp. MJP52]
MNQNCKAAMAAAVAGGYLLGRTKKAKLALLVGTYLAGRRFSLSPSRLAAQGLAKLRETPQFQDLTDQVRHELLQAGRSAVTAAARRKLLDLSESLRDQSERLSGAAAGRGERDEDDGYADEEPAGDAEDTDDTDEDDEEPVADGPRRSSAAGRSTARRATVRRAASTGPAVANAAVRKKTATRSGSGSGSGTRRGK